MTHRYASIFKLCATCGRWAGPREPDALGHSVIVPTLYAKGRCSGGVYNQLMVPASGTCGQYVKWQALR